MSAFKRVALLLAAELITFVPGLPYSAHAAQPIEYRIALLGSPIRQMAWTNAALERLKAIGFNTVQLNIAWGTRPYEEPLNLADVVTVPGETELKGTAARREELKRRIQLAKQHGLRTIFHFGSPYRYFNPYTGEVSYRYHDFRFTSKGYEVPSEGSQDLFLSDTTFDSWYDILNPKVRDHELALLRELRRQFPDVDDLLIYTYDQDSWQTPEYQYSKFSYGVPLDERLPAYVAALHKVWTEKRTGHGRVWWEPWELSAGQVYAMLPKLPRADFGLMLHANIAEVQLALPVDVWLRNSARMARDLGIPVVVEGFFSASTEEIEPLVFPTPRLEDEQYLAFAKLPGIVGIKEYYGLDINAADLNLDMLQARLREPSRSTDELIETITQRFAPVQAEVRAYLALLADAYQVYPWDAAWTARRAGIVSPDHGWSGATIQGVAAESPSWRSTRQSRFMKLDASQPHFWMLEDVQLRFETVADLLMKASTLGARFIDRLPKADDKAHFSAVQRDIETLRRIVTSYALHLRETNVTQMLRQDLTSGRAMTPALVEELGTLLDADVTNQQGKGRVVEMRRLYRENAEAFVRQYLVPTDAPAASGIGLTSR